MFSRFLLVLYYVRVWSYFMWQICESRQNLDGANPFHCTVYVLIHKVFDQQHKLFWKHHQKLLTNSGVVRTFMLIYITFSCGQNENRCSLLPLACQFLGNWSWNKSSLSKISWPHHTVIPALKKKEGKSYQLSPNNCFIGSIIWDFVSTAKRILAGTGEMDRWTISYNEARQHSAGDGAKTRSTWRNVKDREINLHKP